VNFQEMNLRVFQRKSIPNVIFQPRIEPWFHWHKIFNQLPEKYQYYQIPDLFDDLNTSMRYIHYYTGIPDPVVRSFSPDVVFEKRELNGRVNSIYHTPFGTLSEIQQYTIDQTWRTVDFAVKTKDDLIALRWLYENTEYHFDDSAFYEGKEYMGARGEPQFWVPKSPYQALAQLWMKLPDLIYALADFPKIVEATMGSIDSAYDPLFQEICSSGVVKIVNFGENIHEQLLSPKYFENFIIPFWEKRAGQLHDAGIYSHVHIDGFFNNFLPYLRHLPFDGIEALTPRPQGDMTLEDIKANIGDKILIDGIPAVHFLDTYTREQLMTTTERIIDLFHPNLILGISDELPQGAGEEAIERVRWVADYCRMR
jgi:hypothetical protein